MREVLACIVTYNPDIDILKRNIKSFYRCVEKIIIIDNNSNNIQDIRKLCEDKVYIIFNHHNEGIANALNQALGYAIEYNYKYLLTMDQDSFFECENAVGNMFHYFSNEVDAMVVPCTKDMISGKVETLLQNECIVKSAITSGALCSVKILEQIGGWENKLFIDAVDFDLCFRLRKKRFRIKKINNINLCHHLGNSQVKHMMNFENIITNHSHIRRYYQMRNSVYLFKKYFTSFPKEIMRNILSKLKIMLLIILYENNKTIKIKYSLKGWKDGILGKYGKISIK